MRPSKKRLTDAYLFRGFTPDPVVRGVFGDPKAVVITLKRREKKQSARSVRARGRASTTGSSTACGISLQAIVASIWSSNSDASFAGGVRR